MVDKPVFVGHIRTAPLECEPHGPPEAYAAKPDVVVGQPVEIPSRRVAIVHVSEAMLIAALHLPPDTRITDVARNVQRMGHVMLQVEQSDLKLIQQGECVPNAHPQFRLNADTKEIEFLGWGQ